MNLAQLFLGKPEKRKIKVQAHAMTLIAAIWLLFSLIGIFLLIVGLRDHEYSLSALGALALLIQVILNYYAVQYWRREKETEADIYMTNAYDREQSAYKTLNENTTSSLDTNAPSNSPSGDTPSRK